MVSPWLLTKMKYLLGLDPGARNEPLSPSHDNLVVKIKYLLSDEPPPFRNIAEPAERGPPREDVIPEAPVNDPAGSAPAPAPTPVSINIDCDDPHNRDILATIFTEENGRTTKQCITRQDFVSARG